MPRKRVWPLLALLLSQRMTSGGSGGILRGPGRRGYWMLKWAAITQRASRAQDNFMPLVGKKHTIRSSDLGPVAPQLFTGAVPACGEGASLRTTRQRWVSSSCLSCRASPRSCGGEGRLGLPTASGHFLGEACLVSVIQAGPWGCCRWCKKDG